MPLAALTKLAPTSQILFGTDFSPEPIESTVNQLPTSGLSQETLQLMERGKPNGYFHGSKSRRQTVPALSAPFWCILIPE